MRGQTREDYQTDREPLSKRPDLARTERQNHWALPSRTLQNLALASNWRVLLGRILEEEWLLLKAFWKDPDRAISVARISQQDYDMVSFLVRERNSCGKRHAKFLIIYVGRF